MASEVQAASELVGDAEDVDMYRRRIADVEASHVAMKQAVDAYLEERTMLRKAFSEMRAEIRQLEHSLAVMSQERELFLKVLSRVKPPSRATPQPNVTEGTNSISTDKNTSSTMCGSLQDSR